MWDTIIAMALPYFEIILAAFAAKYIASALGVTFAKLIEGVQDLGAKINENKYLKITKFDDWLVERLRSAIEGVQDSYVNNIKEASEDGKLTVDEIKEASDRAWEFFKSSLTKIEWTELTQVLGEDVEAVIRAKIPGLVAALKPFQDVRLTFEENPIPAQPTE